MTLTFPEPKHNQHSRLTLDEAIAQYKAKLLTAAGLIFHAVKVYRKDGHKLRVRSIISFCQRLSINRSTLHKALTKLVKASVGFHWQSEDGLYLWIGDEQDCTQVSHWRADFEEPEDSGAQDTQEQQTLASVPDTSQRSALPSGDKALPIGNVVLPIGDTVLPTGKNQASKPASAKASSSSSTNYQIFFNSLSSDSLRENFKMFVREEWRKLTARNGEPGQEIVSIERFLSREGDLKNWYDRFLASPAGQAAKKAALDATDWTQHPEWSQWLEFMRQSGTHNFVALGECFDRKTRRAIVNWAEERQLVWEAVG